MASARRALGNVLRSKWVRAAIYALALLIAGLGPDVLVGYLVGNSAISPTPTSIPRQSLAHTFAASALLLRPYLVFGLVFLALHDLTTRMFAGGPSDPSSTASTRRCDPSAHPEMRDPEHKGRDPAAGRKPPASEGKGIVEEGALLGESDSATPKPPGPDKDLSKSRDIQQDRSI